MPHAALSVTLLALAVPVAAVADAPVTQVQLAQMTIRQRLVIRVPMTARAAPAVRLEPIKYKEKKGPRCIMAQTMAGALVSAPNQVDLVLLGGTRVRAKLDGDCKPLDFYSGFYVRPAKDGMICADRDAIRVRSGAACEIERFRLLQVVK